MTSTIRSCGFRSALVLVIVACLSPGAPSVVAQELRRFEWIKPAMGVEFRFVVYVTQPESAAAAQDKAALRLEELEQIFSDYRPDSEINRLVQTPELAEGVSVSTDLYQLFSAARNWSERSQGAFDVTIGPLSQLWRQARKHGKLPEPAAIESARERVGFRHWELMGETRLSSQHVNGQLDFGGIAKGYAADQILNLFRQLQIQAALVDASGDIATLGELPGKTRWRIELPEQDDVPALVLRLSGQSVATSGSLYQKLELDGQRYSHLIDPRTGWAIRHTQRVTVIANDATTADALASACSVLAPEESLELVGQVPGAEVLLLAERGQGGQGSPQPAGHSTTQTGDTQDFSDATLKSLSQQWSVWSSPGFAKYLNRD